MARDANSKERLVPLNPRPRHVDHDETYGPNDEPGYRCVARRPRVPHYNEMVEPERADRVEEIMKDFPTSPDDMGY